MCVLVKHLRIMYILVSPGERTCWVSPGERTCMSRPERNAAINNGIVLLLRTITKKITLTFHRSFYECLISSNGSTQAAGCFKEVEEEDITRLRGMTLFGIIKQMQHLCGVASMIVSPSCIPLFVTLGLCPQMTKLPRGIQSCWQPHRDVAFV